MLLHAPIFNDCYNVTSEMIVFKGFHLSITLIHAPLLLSHRFDKSLRAPMSSMLFSPCLPCVLLAVNMLIGISPFMYEWILPSL
jgi:hypothetical protein